MFNRIVRGLEMGITLLILALLVNYGNPSLSDPIEKVRAYTRQIEFNYVTWMANAAMLKLRSASIGVPYTLNNSAQKQTVTEYFRVTRAILEKEYQLEQIYADAAILDKESASASVREELALQQARQSELAPFAEAVLQDQVSQILAELGLTALGQPLPNVLYHSTALPMALIVSPRDRIEQTANISINMDITVDEQAALESRVDKGLNSSSLVVHIGGVGVYPTMVMRSTDMRWMLSTVAHEWIHNYLTLRPLGILYSNTPELRTMNETTASIAGNEIGELVIERFYPELKSASHPRPGLISVPFDRAQPADLLQTTFDFRGEMRETRVDCGDRGDQADQQSHLRERSRPDWYRTRCQGRVRPARGGDAVAENGKGRRQFAARVHEHPSQRRDAAATSRRTRAEDDAVLPGGWHTAQVPGAHGGGGRLMRHP